MTEPTGFARILPAPLLLAAQRGSMPALAEIYGLYGRACYNLALRLLGRPAAAEDVVQEVFLKLMGAVTRFRGDAPFGAWLKRLVVNGAIDSLRRERHFDDGDSTLVLAQQSAPEIAMDAQQDAMALLRQLPPRARAVLVLHELEGYTHKELAALLGQSESYSKSLLARSLARLHAWADTPTVEAGHAG